MFRAESKPEDSEDLGWFDAVACDIQFQDMDGVSLHLAYIRILSLRLGRGGTHLLPQGGRCRQMPARAT